MNIEIKRLGYDEIINSCFAQFKAYNDAFCKDIFPDENPDSQERLKEIINEKDCEVYRFTAFDDDKIIGSISSGKLKPEHPEYNLRKHVSWLEGFVLPQYRRQGIGKQLARLALEMAFQNGVEVV
ncbi:MAG: GNAT family N-acetyltransferase, partial [Caldiserica bacterium]|nr:GNAT family N-acetyltransferase [Caldisericota bacterium]